MARLLRRLRRGATRAALLCLLSGTALAASPREAGQFVIDAWIHADVAAVEALFDADMKRALPADKLSDTMAQIRGIVGGLVACDAPAMSARSGVTFADYPCRFEHGTGTLQLAWNPDGTLGGLGFPTLRPDQDLARLLPRAAAVPGPPPTS